VRDDAATVAVKLVDDFHVEVVAVSLLEGFAEALG